MRCSSTLSLFPSVSIIAYSPHDWLRTSLGETRSNASYGTIYGDKSGPYIHWASSCLYPLQRLKSQHTQHIIHRLRACLHDIGAKHFDHFIRFFKNLWSMLVKIIEVSGQVVSIGSKHIGGQFLACLR